MLAKESVKRRLVAAEGDDDGSGGGGGGMSYTEFTYQLLQVGGEGGRGGADKPNFRCRVLL